MEKKSGKQFFLGTLDISQKTIYNIHETSNAVGNIPERLMQGKHRKHKIPEEKVQAVRDHINSIPKIESHYCRADTSKEYLDSSLNISKLYDLYKEQMAKKDENPVKLSYYREIFSTEFNLAFQRPKKDRCDVCELQRLQDNKRQEIIDASQQEYKNHI